jgi:protein O-GlcNAc transferase
MDPEKFAQELPRLFEDFPRSEHPSRLRFDDVVSGVPNLAQENNLALVNLAASLLEPGESYVEAGTYMGASLIAAMRGNEGKDFVAIDSFGFGPLEVKGRSLPKAGRKALEANLARFGAEGATILEGDVFELLRGGALEGRTVGVWYYDAAHDYESQLDALRLIEPWLAERALVVVDDSDWEDVARATREYLASQPKAGLLLEIQGADHGQPWWWEGVQALGWQ